MLYQKHYSSVDSKADINISFSTTVAFLKSSCVGSDVTQMVTEVIPKGEEGRSL